MSDLSGNYPFMQGTTDYAFFSLGWIIVCRREEHGRIRELLGGVLAVANRVAAVTKVVSVDVDLNDLGVLWNTLTQLQACRLRDHNVS